MERSAGVGDFFEAATGDDATELVASVDYRVELLAAVGVVVVERGADILDGALRREGDEVGSHDFTHGKDFQRIDCVFAA
jgi:hypothetical protein